MPHGIWGGIKSSRDSWYQSQSLGEITSSTSEASTGNQQGGKKRKDKIKDLAILVNDKLAEVNDSMITLTGRVDEMEKRIEELES